MKIQTPPIRLNDRPPRRSLTVHAVALATFKLLRKAGSQAASVPGALQGCARDIATAWADSRPKA